MLLLLVLFVGKYEFIGENEASGIYFGTITIIEEHGKLKVRRHIGKK